MKAIEVNIRVIYLLFLVSSLMFGCSNKPTGKNHGRVSSESGKYVAVVLAKQLSKDETDLVWQISIFDKDKRLLYQDNSSDISANFSVYWGWHEDVFWLYNSDNGLAVKWSRKGDANEWTKVIDVKPKDMPQSILPKYAK